MKRTLFILAAMLASASVARAQYVVPDEGVSTVVMNFLAAPRDPAALGMGATGALGRSAAFATFSNPAYIPFSDDAVSIGASCGLWQPGMAASTADCSFGFSYNNAGKMGIGFCFATDPQRVKTVPSNEIGTRTIGPQPSTMMVGGSFAYRPLECLSIGANARYANQSLVGYDLNAFVADAYLLFTMKGMLATVGVSNVGSFFDGNYNIPSSAVAAIGYEHDFGKHGIMACAQYEHYFYGADRISIGGHYRYGGIVTVRAGYNAGGGSPLDDFASLGLGLHFGHIGLDGAYLISDGALGGTVCFGLNLNF